MQTNFTKKQQEDPEIKNTEDILRKCVHCGMCNATCPTFQVLGDELDGPRGRIYLIKDMIENNKAPTEKVVKHIDRCLSCYACMTTCPSGVNYMHIIDHGRNHIERNYKRPFLDRLLRNMLSYVLPRPNIFLLLGWLTEITKPPLQYPVVMIIAIASILGGTFALAVASLSTSLGFNWRIAFWIGAGIALIGAVARTTLRETIDFADAKRKIKLSLNKNKIDTSKLPYNQIYQEKTKNLTLLSLFFIQCGWPTCFYITYIHCGNIGNYNCIGVRGDNPIKKVPVSSSFGYLILDSVVAPHDKIDVSRQSIKSMNF
jgi:ferredoxin